MTLSEWLSANNLPVREFAARMGVHEITVHRWKAGVLFPRRAALAKIEEETGGAVTASDFMVGPGHSSCAETAP